MKAYMSGTKQRRLLTRMALCAAVVLISASGAPAAETRAGGGAIGPSQGTAGGGVIGANRGGASGISNPSPGGPAGSFGGSEGTVGPRATTNSRPGYLGGRITDTTPGTDPPPAAAVAATSQQLGHCDLTANRMLTPEQRMVGGNGRRLQYGSSVMAPNVQSRHQGSLHALLASYQEELEKSRPDPMLAGVYLGIAANVPVSAREVSALSEALCVPVDANVAEQIASVAEAQRQKLAGEKQIATAASQ